MVGAHWLTLTDLTVRRRGKTLLGPVSFALNGSGLTILMGPNGAGKTTLLRAIHGIERLNDGRIEWHDPKDADGRSQGFVFQQPVLMRRSVLDCIAYPLRLDGLSAAQAREAARAAADEVHLRVNLDQPVFLLSGGEKQKMALARALVRAPRILFLDEPCANLDGHAIIEIEEILNRVRAGGTRILMSTHDQGQARRLADSVLFLHKGQLVEQTEGREFFSTPRTEAGRAFLKGEILL